MSTLTRYNNYINNILDTGDIFDFCEKKRAINQNIFYMLNRTQSIFKWQNLPDTIPERILELYLQTNGHICFYEYENNLYIFTGGLGGEPDVYYQPTIYTIANPALNISKNLIINKDCILMLNDSLYMGLIPLFKKYATALSENELSIKIAIQNSRIVNLISAPDDRTKASAEKYLEDIANGKQGIIAENAFLDGIKTQPYATPNNNILTNLIEMEQYLKASWFNEIGLNANYNMKRESINAGESQLNNDALTPLVDNMLEQRRIAIDKVNAKYNTNISVDLASAWKDNELEQEAELENINDEVDENEEN